MQLKIFLSDKEREGGFRPLCSLKKTGFSKLIFYILSVDGRLNTLRQSSHHFKRKKKFRATNVYISEILINDRGLIIQA